MPFPSETLYPSETIFPGDTDETPPGEVPAARITWSEPETRMFETGLDRGVLYPKNSPAVAWNGLTAVDQAGAEAGSAFYIDGRPFLFLPTPKEYEATLKAYTYPDEFSALMGVVEATDGMYLDSQQGDSFDLSYRTLVGSGVDGSTAGYKIHLIYNATVAPQATSYQTLSEDVNPSEFSWQIQAVPVPVPGFRPTAHIIIDTRHIDSIRLEGIETMLYGDDLTLPSMPDPVEIFDLLNFGATIIITDHGNGTWTAEGSYLNVHEITPGIFELNNIDGLYNGDGTFTISSTP